MDMIYLDDERKKLWAEIQEIHNKIEELNDSLKKKTSDYEHDAKVASTQASLFRNKCSKSSDIAEEHLSKISQIFDSISISQTESSQIIKDIKTDQETISNQLSEANDLSEKLEQLVDIIETAESLNNSVAETANSLSKSQELLNKSTGVYNALLKRKDEIDEAYYEIFGYEETNDQGETTHVEGLKDSLKKSFNQLKSEIDKIKKENSQFYEQISAEYKDNYDSLAATTTNRLTSWKNEHEEIITKIENLLPDALTAGLSSAFSEKRKSEIKEGENLSTLFKHAIWGLVVVSLIPFGVDVFLLIKGNTLESVISELPRLAFAILPLYIPFLWLAYSSNKKTNLSKRLVEEYTHKEVLSKTFEGLSNQIENIPQESISNELRIKLLYNMLDVSYENPGKLISDYNKADHPIIDALDKTTKLDDAIDKLHKIPGLSKIAELLKSKSESIITSQTSKIEAILDSKIDNETNS